MKTKFIRSLALAVFALLSSNSLTAQSMMSGSFPGTIEFLLGSRFRNVRNDNTTQTNYTGIPDLNSNRGSGTRNTGNIVYGNAGVLQFTITYNVSANTLTTSATNGAGQTFTNVLNNVSTRLTNDGKSSNPVAINFMRLIVGTQTGSSSIVVSNLTIDGLAINGNYGRTNNNGTSQWYITSALLNNGFVVTGTITATGNFANSDNNQIVELNFGYTPTPNAGVLPVSWGEVAARSTTTGNRITWTTLQETNTSHFDVQRSVDGVRFTTIGTVAAAGQSDRSISYQFDDRTAQAGTVYYRLLQVDKDGRQSFSTVVKVQTAAGAANRVAVSGTTVRIDFTRAADRTIQVLDMNGRLVRQVRSADAIVTLNTSEFNNGMYVLVINNPGQQQETHRFVK